MLSQKKITKKDMRIDETSKEKKGEREREERERESQRPVPTCDLPQLRNKKQKNKTNQSFPKR
jgi:hypothetical protein